MRRRLLLFRHAKSAWSDQTQADIDRPLAPRGESAAALMADAMAKRDLLPDRILCSPARRARETLAALRRCLPATTAIEISPTLYEPPSGDYRAAIEENGGKAATLMLIGHNPAIQRTALSLARDGDRGLLTSLASKFPTATLAAIDFDELKAWDSLPKKGGRLAVFLTPRDLGGDADD